MNLLKDQFDYQHVIQKDYKHDITIPLFLGMDSIYLINSHQTNDLKIRIISKNNIINEYLMLYANSNVCAVNIEFENNIFLDIINPSEVIVINLIMRDNKYSISTDFLNYIEPYINSHMVFRQIYSITRCRRIPKNCIKNQFDSKIVPIYSSENNIDYNKKNIEYIFNTIIIDNLSLLTISID